MWPLQEGLQEVPSDLATQSQKKQAASLAETHSDEEATTLALNASSTKGAWIVDSVTANSTSSDTRRWGMGALSEMQVEQCSVLLVAC